MTISNLYDEIYNALDPKKLSEKNLSKDHDFQLFIGPTFGIYWTSERVRIDKKNIKEEWATIDQVSNKRLISRCRRAQHTINKIKKKYDADTATILANGSFARHDDWGDSLGKSLERFCKKNEVEYTFRAHYSLDMKFIILSQEAAALFLLGA